MSEKEQKEVKCICPKCPSFVDCKSLAFCFKGKSKCIKNEKGCICPSCPVQKKFNFKHIYYCTGGSEKQINKK